MSDITQLIDNLSDNLQTLAPDATWVASGPVGASRKCDVYTLTNSKSALRLALKVYRPAIASEQASQIQFRALQRVQKARRDDPFMRAPEPYACLADHQAILMSWHDSPNLTKALWNLLAQPQSRLNLIADAGRWLRKFHEISCISPAALDTEKLVAKLQNRINRCADGGETLLNTSDFKRALECFVYHMEAFKASAPHALLHGDYTPSNLLVDDQGIFGMDMWGGRLGCVMEDAARLLTYLAIQSPYTLANTPLHSDGKFPATFAKGYGREVLDIQSPTWKLLLMYQQLRRWVVYHDRMIKNRPTLQSRWLLSRTKKICMQSLSWLEHC